MSVNNQQNQYMIRKSCFKSMIAILSITTLLLIYVLAASSDSVLNALPVIYGVQYAFILHRFYRFHGGLHALLRPSMVGMTYLNISFVVGALAYSFDLILSQENVSGYLGWSNIRGSVMFFLMANFIVSLAALVHMKPMHATVEHKPVRLNSNLVVFRICLVGLLAISNTVESDFVPVFRMAVALAIFVSFFKTHSPYRWIVVFGVIFGLALVSFHSKRDAIFLIFPAFLLEISLFKVRRINGKLMSGVLIGVTSVFYLIAAMSIMRGYGMLDPRDFFDALSLVPKYLSDPLAVSFLLNNFEFSSVFFHSHNAVQMLNNGQASLAYGETLLKPLFIGIPEDFLGYKPRSSIELYTVAWAPEFRAIGGSLPITAFSEMYWNFAWLGLIPLFLVFFGIEALFSRGSRTIAKLEFLSSSLFLSFYVLVLYFVRGAGIDLIMVYLALVFLSLIFLVAPLSFVLLGGKRAFIGKSGFSEYTKVRNLYVRSKL